MLIEPHDPKGKRGRPPFGFATMLRLHFMQRRFGLWNPAREEAPHDVPLYRQFAGLDARITRLSDETTILRFGHLLERHHRAGPTLASINELLRGKGLTLRAGSVVDATRIAPRSPPDDLPHASLRSRAGFQGTYCREVRVHRA